ncbi:MAG: 3-phosphoshikimate 1-carboxyvinyltransferase [Desulfatiglandales bacterium]
MSLIEIPRKSKVSASIEIPGSKSLTHRALILSFLSNSRCLIKNPSLCEDTLSTLRALRLLGSHATINPDSILLDATAISIPEGDKILDVGESGTTLRLILGVLAIFPCRVHIKGRGRLNKRPVGPLAMALQKMGASITWHHKEGCLPLTVEGKRPKGGTVRIYGGESSQYISSLMLVGPLLDRGLRLVVEGPFLSRPYVEMTAGIMESFGAEVEFEDHIVEIRPGGYRGSKIYHVEPDLSNASYFMGLPLLVGGKILIRGLFKNSLQGDLGILRLIEEMGGKCGVEEEGIWVEGGEIRNIEADMGDMPDLVPTIGAVAVHAEGPTKIWNVPHLRIKESDRIESICREWQKLHVETTPMEDGLVVHGKGGYKGSTVHSHGDHRIAMAIALLASRGGGVRLSGHEVVKKSFPGFWDTWFSL